VDCQVKQILAQLFQAAIEENPYFYLPQPAK